VKVKVGQALQSTVDATAVIVIRAPATEVELTCGGAALVDKGAAVEAGAADPSKQGGTLLGKRYADEALGLELLCTKAGAGTLEVDGAPIALKDAKPLPASD
jgi:alcohol dehydrogenase YqhD (iron-dependent ADH family)